jgi:hypothetical protein
MNADLRDVDPIDNDPALRRVDEAQHAHRERALARARAAEEADALAMSVWPAVLLGQYAGGREPSMIAGGSCGRSRYSTTRSTELRTHQPLPLFDVGTTHFKSSSSPVQNRHAQYTPDVNAMADVMHTPARPASTTPESAKSVVTNTVHAPTTSKRRSSQRFIIQNPYHI